MSVALTQLTEGLNCYNLLNVMKENKDLFQVLFCPSKKFKWDFETVRQKMKPQFSDDGTNTKIKEVSVYKMFLDFVERCFFDGNLSNLIRALKLSFACHITYWSINIECHNLEFIRSYTNL